MNSRFFRNGVVMLALVVVALAVVFTVVNNSPTTKPTDYSVFLTNVQNGDVKLVSQEASTLTVTPTDGTESSPYCHAPPSSASM